MQELQQRITEALSGGLPDQTKTAERMLGDVKAAADLKVGSALEFIVSSLRISNFAQVLHQSVSSPRMQAVLDEMASSGVTSHAPKQAKEPSSAYADAFVALLSCTQTTASEVGGMLLPNSHCVWPHLASSLLVQA